MAESHWPAFVEVRIGRWIGDDIAHLHPGGVEGWLIVSEHGVSLNHLSATGVAGDDDLLHIGKLLAITQAGDDFVQRRKGAETERRSGFATRHPLIALPAQNRLGDGMHRDVGFIEELWGDDQCCRTLPGQFRRVFAAVQVGLCVAQATMDDDQHSFDFGRARADAHRDLA